MNLRELYKEKGIKNINATVLEKRENSMEEILENRRLEHDEWNILADWLMGVEEDEKTEKVLIKLEELFCEFDKSFSKENEKEMHILGGELIYRYCQETREITFPLMVLCGYNIGYKIKSEIIYKEFVCLLNEWRLDLRRDGNEEEMIKLPDTAKLRKTVADKQKETEDEGTEWVSDQDDWNGILVGLESCEKAIGFLVKKNEQYRKMLEVQREESDILWWMINEWSDTYEQPFRMLKREQIALMAPVELQNMINYYLGPFAVKQVLYKVISLAQNENHRMTMSQLVNTADEKLLDQIDVDEWKSSKVQPVLLALQCRIKAGEEGWKGLFTRMCKINPDEFKMTLEEFSYQLYLELELAILLAN